MRAVAAVESDELILAEVIVLRILNARLWTVKFGYRLLWYGSQTEIWTELNIAASSNSAFLSLIKRLHRSMISLIMSVLTRCDRKNTPPWR